MEPITLATSLATIVSLTADFVSSRRGDEAQTIDAYVDWLRREEHKELADMIGSNIDLSRSLQTLLAGQHAAVMSKLDELDKIFSAVARNLDGFAGIAAAVRPDAILSEQCISILRQIHDAGASFFVESKALRGTATPRYLIVDGKRDDLKISEPTFIKPDIDTLCALGLLTPDIWGDSVAFRITRTGYKLGTPTPPSP